MIKRISKNIVISGTEKEILEMERLRNDKKTKIQAEIDFHCSMAKELREQLI